MGLGEVGTKEYLQEIGLSRHEETLLPKQDADREVITAASLDGWEYETAKIDPRKSVVRRSPKGRKGITTNGAKMVRSACYALQKEYKRKRLGFMTLTLPNHPEYLPIWVSRWPELVRKFTQEFKREMERVGGVPELVGVTEIQTQRSDDLGYCVPHFHAVYVSWDGKAKGFSLFHGDDKPKPCFYISHHRMQEIWGRILVNEITLVTGIKPNPDEISPRIDLQAVKKSAEGYLGKYMSKGANDVKKYLDADPTRTDIPSHWWHMTQGLRTVLKALIKPLPPALVQAVIESSEELIESGIVRYIREIKKVINGIERTIGYAFRFAPDYNPTKPKHIREAFSTS